LEWTTKFLRDRGADSPRLDAEVLLAEAPARTVTDKTLIGSKLQPVNYFGTDKKCLWIRHVKITSSSFDRSRRSKPHGCWVLRPHDRNQE